MIKFTQNNSKVGTSATLASTSQGIEAVSEDIASLDAQTIQLTRNQVKEAVIEALTSLESKAIQWSEILDVMSNLAIQRGKYQLGDFIAMSSEQIWEVENT